MPGENISHDVTQGADCFAAPFAQDSQTRVMLKTYPICLEWEFIDKTFAGAGRGWRCVKCFSIGSQSAFATRLAGGKRQGHVCATLFDSPK